MDIILLEDVPHLGSVGQLLKVKRGFARNYLLPKKLAVLASVKNQKQLKHQQWVAQFKRQKMLAHTQALAERLQTLILTIARKVGEQDKLYGSVTNHDIQEALAVRGIEIERRHIQLSEPIRTLGEVIVPVRLAIDTRCNIRVQVIAEA